VGYSIFLFSIGDPSIQRTAVAEDGRIRGGLDHHGSGGLDDRRLRAGGVVNVVWKARKLGGSGFTFHFSETKPHGCLGCDESCDGRFYRDKTGEIVKSSNLHPISGLRERPYCGW
jgi:hypothetical protein